MTLMAILTQSNLLNFLEEFSFENLLRSPYSLDFTASDNHVLKGLHNNFDDLSLINGWYKNEKNFTSVA